MTAGVGSCQPTRPVSKFLQEELPKVSHVPWLKALKTAPKAMVKALRDAENEGVPSRLGKHPTLGWCLVQTGGQGSFIALTEK